MRRAAILLAATVAALVVSGVATAAEGASYKTVGGLTVYLGVLPAAMIQGETQEHVEEAHGEVPRGPHAYHLVAAVFDAETGERIEDASVRARVSPRRLAPVTRALEPMVIAGTVTYGNYFTMGGNDPYEITLTLTRPTAVEPVVVQFAYEHGIR